MECCGVLMGDREQIADALPAHNIADQPESRFLVDPLDHFNALRAARARGLDVVGFYHSHPDHPARPSQHDLEQAWPNFTYIIVSVITGKPHEITAWRLREDRSGFDQEEF